MKIILQESCIFNELILFFNILFQQISCKLSIIQNTLQNLSVIFMLNKEKKDNF